MSDSGNGNSNSWTVIAPEETVAETVRPVAEGAEPHEDLPSDRFTTKPAGGAAERGSGTSPVFSEESCSVERQQAPQEIESEINKVTTAHMEDTAPAPDPAPDLTVTPDPIAVSEPPLPSSPEVLGPGPTHDLSLTSGPNLTSVSDDRPPSSIEALHSSRCDADTLSQSAAPVESSAPSSPDPDLFSDSYTHISPEPAYPPTPETLGAQELAQEEEGLIQEEEGLIQEEEGLIQEEEESELSQRVAEVGKRADLPSDSEVGLERAEEQGAEGESGLRRRRPSLQSALERIGRCGGEEEDEEEDEEEGEEFRLPPRGEEDSGFSLNKCILGAVILLGLGTIFFSEGEYDVGRELRDAETPGKQEWLNPEVLVDVDKAELLSKESLEQITVLQAQLQAQKEELKVAQGQAAEGAKERLRREEVEKENAQQVDPDPESATGLPPTVQEEEGSQTTGSPVEEAKRSREGEKTEKDWAGGKERKKERYEQGEQGKRWKDKGEQREWKEDGKKERKAEKEWKKGKHDQEKDGKGRKQKEEKKQWKGKEERRGEWKNEKASRGEEGKRWKEKEEKKEWKERGERKDGKKGKHDHWNEEKEWKDKSDTKEKKGKKEHEWKKGKDEGREEKEWRKSKDEGRREKEWRKDEGRGEKEWRKSKDGGKGWKDQGERKEWKSNKDIKKKDGKREGSKEWQEERKPWQGKDKEGSRDGERRGWKEERKDGDWKKDKGGDRKSKDKYSQEKSHQQQYDYREREEEEWKKEKKERAWPGPGSKSPPQSHRQPPLEQPDYWDRQRARLQRNPRPAAQCTSVESCAQAEGLVPVPLPEFQALLTAYLAKAEAVGVEASKREELSKLAVEFFKDGVFTHDQMSFQDFAEDVADILEDMVEKEDDDDDVDGDDDGDDDDEKEPGIEEEMDGFEDEAMKLFALPGEGEKEQRKKGEWKKESGRGRG